MDGGDYDIRLDDKYGYSQLIDVGAEAAANEPWFHQTLTSVNDSEGADTVTLEVQQGYAVPKGVVHRTRAAERTAILMVESAGVDPTGD